VVSELGDGEVLGYNGEELRFCCGCAHRRRRSRNLELRVRLSGHLNALLVACWPVMPDERAQHRRTAARGTWPWLATMRRGTGDARRPLATTRRGKTAGVGH